MSKALDTQVGGQHYKQHKIQPWHIIDEYDLDFYLGNTVKYVLREKGDKIEDLEKAADVHLLSFVFYLVNYLHTYLHTFSITVFICNVLKTIYFFILVKLHF